MSPDRPGDDDKRRVRELTALYAVAVAMNQAVDEGDALAQALGRVLDVLELDAGRIFLLNPSDRRLSLVTTRGNPALLDSTETSITPGFCLCGIALERGEPLQAMNAGHDLRVVGAGCRGGPRHACLAVPLLANERMLGVLHVTSLRPTGFSQGDVALLRSVAAQMGMGIENMRLRDAARRADALGALLQEMHHRIKNNLQTVADLLSLEAAGSTSPEARKSLRDSISRIKSIAAVHQLLSVEQLRVTDITELARQVCSILQQHLAWPKRQLDLSVIGPPIYLPTKQATAVALVLNEMVANAIEHAFPDGSGCGRVSIALNAEGGRILLAIEDDGLGLPDDFDLNRSQGLGLKIVRTLVERDLAGALAFECPEGGGTRATITFYQ